MHFGLFDVFEVVLQLGVVAFEAARLVLIQIVLNAKGIKLNPITSLFVVSVLVTCMCLGLLLTYPY